MTTPTTARTGAHAPDALLGLANALTGLGDKRAACATLDKLRTEFPNCAAISATGRGRPPARRLLLSPAGSRSARRSSRRDGAAGPVRAGAAPRGRRVGRSRQPGARLARARLGGGRGGSVRALIVDHGLRPEAAREAGAPNGWRNEGFPSSFYASHPAWPCAGRAGAQGALRALAAAAGAGILHLLLGHHAADQAETS